MSSEHMHGGLRLLPPAPTPAALPDLAPVYEDQLRRPGELHEPFPLLPGALASVEQPAVAADLPTGTTARLLIEAALVRAELAAAGQGEAECCLNLAAANARVRRRLSAAEADYVRGLRYGRGSARTLATLPVRLISRAKGIDIEAALRDDVLQAVAWETAAMLSGCTMLEWALMAVLASA